MEREIGGWGGDSEPSVTYQCKAFMLTQELMNAAVGGGGGFSLTFMVTQVNISCGIVLKSMVNS